MSVGELGIVVAGAAVGWWVVSFVIDRLRPPPPGPAAPRPAEPAPVAPAPPAPAPAPDPAAERPPSVAELGESWWRILGVERDAAVEAIEAAYHARVAALDAVRFEAGAAPAGRERAAAERAAVEAAYEFIRAARAAGTPAA